MKHGINSARFAVFVALTSISGCATRVIPEENGAEPVETGTRPRSAAPAPITKLVAPPQSAQVVRGFAQRRSASKMAVGEPASFTVSPSIGEVERYTGPLGTFVRFANGLSAGRPHARSPSFELPPLSTSGETHNARVKSYFLTAGLPSEQVSNVEAHAMMESSGTSTVLGSSTKHLGYVTVIRRQIDGCQVDGSVAWAQFNANDEVVAETVWWPELPAQVLNDIILLRATVSEPARATAFKDRLPPEVRELTGAIVVHHSPPMAPNWSATVAMDFIRPGWPAARSFDRNGVPIVVHPHVPVAGDNKPGLKFGGDAGGGGQ